VATEECLFWVPRLPEISDGLGSEGAGDSVVGLVDAEDSVIALAEGIIALAEAEDSVMEFVEVWDSVGWIVFKGFGFVAKPRLKAEVVFNGRPVISG
jgi:hypothetical protein